MAVSNIPVLSPDYLPFDWNDWLNSLAALVPGGSTSDFEKECWNAIVSKVDDVLTDSGMEWDSTYTSYGGAMISETYGDLYAKAFNSVRHNIDGAVPTLRWNWADDPSSRGYIGRKDFRGVDDHGDASADDVYPEYFIELVNRLNFLISVLTGEKAAIVGGEGLARSTDRSLLLAPLSDPLAASGYGLSISGGLVIPTIPAPLFYGGATFSNQASFLTPGVAAPLSHLHILQSVYDADMAKAISGNLSGHRYITRSRMAAEMDVYNAARMASTNRSFSNGSGVIAQGLPKPFGLLSGFSKSGSETTITAPPVYHIIGKAGSETSNAAAITRSESKAMAVKEVSATIVSASAEISRISPLEFGGNGLSIYSAGLKAAADLGVGRHLSNTVVSAALHLTMAGWFEPVQTGSNLYISSVWFSYRDQNDLNIDLVEFYKPIQRNGDLYIRSAQTVWTDGDKANIDTEFFLDPIQSGSNLYIRQDVLGG